MFAIQRGAGGYAPGRPMDIWTMRLGGAAAAAVDNAPLRGCVAHRRRLRPHAHSPRQRMQSKKTAMQRQPLLG